MDTGVRFMNSPVRNRRRTEFETIKKKNPTETYNCGQEQMLFVLDQ